MKQFTNLLVSVSSASRAIPSPQGGKNRPSTATWEPPVDVYERADAVLVIVELPGVNKDDITVTVQQGVLRIAGVREPCIPPDAHHVYQIEIPHGPFLRVLRLPQCSDEEQIEAHHCDGFLRILIPRKDQNDC